MPQAMPDEAELIAYLRKTEMPTILVEGKSDASIYRFLERKINLKLGSILVCDGRDALLSTFDKRSLFAGKKIIWLADSDLWVFGNKPVKYDGVIFTSGYSIENDLYAGSVIENLLEDEELAKFEHVLDHVCKWFAFEVQEAQGGRYYATTTHDATMPQQPILKRFTTLTPSLSLQVLLLAETIRNHQRIYLLRSDKTSVYS